MILKMKKKGIQKIELKRLTIAKMNAASMKNIDGGSSVLTSEYSEHPNGVMIDYCYNEK